ncbi:MAG: DUF4097 domain-containing protein [marine benthic group bacterium]|jgi:DUF4097 and DUF4098 domain-containing protein YvlB|nr:DUF4097 domain-containing protein [Candidatus Benthicola marisminoris]
MIAHVTAAMLAALAPAQQADTTFAVDAGGRLEVNQLEGVVNVTTWDQAEMRVVAAFDEDEGRLDVGSSGGNAQVSVKGEWGEPVYGELDITMPRGMALEIAGVSLEVGIDGSAGDVTVSTVEGSIGLVGGSGNVALSAVEGEVTVSRASGKIAISAVDGGVSVSQSEGAIALTAVDGDVMLEVITSDNVSVNVVDGDIAYEGTIADGGRYVLSTHDGDLDVLIPDGANARISIDTFSGELDTDFPVELEGDFGKKRISFTVGTGKALVELSAFDGTISLRQE